MSQTFRILHAACALSVPIALGIAPAHAVAQGERYTLSGAEVAVYNIAGRVTVEAGTGPDVVVEVVRRGPDASRLRIETGEVRGRNALRVVYPDDDIIYSDGRYRGRSSSTTLRLNDDGTWGSGYGRRGDRREIRVRSTGRGTEAWADVRIFVPRGRVLDTYLAVGELSATGTDATLRLDVAAADVTTTRVRGALTIDSGSGAIDVREANVGLLDVDTGSGSVQLSGVTAGQCHIDSGSGSISADTVTCERFSVDVGSGAVRLGAMRAPEVRVESGSGRVEIALTSTIRSLVVESGSGSVSVAMPEQTNAAIDVSTGSGVIDTDFPVQVTRIERRQMRGRIGSGSGAGDIRIETGSGSIRLRRN